MNKTRHFCKKHQELFRRKKTRKIIPKKSQVFLYLQTATLEKSTFKRAPDLEV